MAKTKIEWCARPGTIPESWNPITGCTKVSPGCKHCYAERMARRLAGRHGYPEYPHHFDVTLHPDRLEQPLKWKKPRTVFVCSMSDLFHTDIPFSFVTEVFSRMALAEDHTFIILTKRPHRMRTYFEFWAKYLGVEQVQPLSNVWLGVTAENQRCADERIHVLLQVPAVVRFVSCEPLLSSIDFQGCLGNVLVVSKQSSWKEAQISWIITGGESGHGARPMDPQWAKDIRDQCKAVGVAYFHKQNGEYIPADGWNQWGTFLNGELVNPARVRVIQNTPGDIYSTVHMVRVGKKCAGRLLDGQEWNEFPKIDGG